MLRGVVSEEYVEYQLDTSPYERAGMQGVLTCCVCGRDGSACVCCCRIRFERSSRSRGVVENGVLVVGLHGHVV